MGSGLFTIGGASAKLLKTKLFKIGDTNPDDPAEFKSMFGLPVYSNIKIDPFNYDTLSGENVSIKDSITIDTVLMTITQSKNIVTTPIQGRNGTVKEYVSDGDYQIDISGTIVSKSNNYPTQDVNTLVQICKSPVALTIISEYLQYFGIHDVVIQDFSFPQTQGFRNQQEFSISCLSDTPVELENINY